MKVERKIEVLQNLYNRLSPYDFFMCNILEEFVDENTRKVILDELWKDRSKARVREGNRPFVWYDMGGDEKNIKVRRQNINRTIKRLKAKL